MKTSVSDGILVFCCTDDVGKYPPLVVNLAGGIVCVTLLRDGDDP